MKRENCQTMNRLKHLPTLRIQPDKSVELRYREKPMRAVWGDTVATALFANGVRIFSRSLKYHRPRGLYSLDGESANTYMNIDGMPNMCAEITKAEDGMRITPQNVVGTPEYDVMSFMDKLSFAMPAGFYYRSMHKPAKIWPIAMKQIRKAAGLGVIKPDFEMKGVYDEIYLNCEVLVIGGGPAGMAAALKAAEKADRVVILESRPWLGGFYDYRTKADSDGVPLYERSRSLAARVEETANIRIFTDTPAVGVYSNNLVTAFQRGKQTDVFDERYVEIRAKSVVVATGCTERPLLFENNEKPGVMQPSCAHRLMRTYGIMAGKKAVVSIGSDLGLEACLDMNDMGLEIACVADTRQDGSDVALTAEIEKRGIPYRSGWTAQKAHGFQSVSKATLTSVNGVHSESFDCDLLLASAGFTPVNTPLILAGAKLAFDNHTGFFLAEKLPPAIYPAGRMLGFTDPSSIEASGELAAVKALMDLGLADLAAAESKQNRHSAPERGSKFVCAPVCTHKTFICFDEDTTLKNIDQAVDDGFDVPELIKRYTTAGTGPGQGGISGHNLPLYVKQACASPASAPMPTTARPPMVPTFMGTYAGVSHAMTKRTPVHDSQEATGGKMEVVGVWNRVRYFSEDKTSSSEIEQVRNSVGMLDASTLGKFRIYGPDALKALDRVYVGDMRKVKEGRIKYSAMCNDDGCLVDDGVVTKIAENDYYFTTSTGRAGQTVEWIRFHTRYDGWNFAMVNLTDCYGVINLAGPNARKVLEKVTDADVSSEAFPFAGYKEFMIKNIIPVKAMRLGFVGELSYEFHVPSSYMQSLWDILRDAGREFSISNFGLEAQSTLRMEKGHVIIGSESEQRTTLLDVGLGFLWSKNKADKKTVGAYALKETENQADRLKLVGLEMETAIPAKDGAIVVSGDKILGYICVSRFSRTLNKAIAMALVHESISMDGAKIDIFEDNCNGKLKFARVVPMPFYDPSGERMKM